MTRLEQIEAMLDIKDEDKWDKQSFELAAHVPWLLDRVRELRGALLGMQRTHGMHGPCRDNSCSDCEREYDKSTQALRNLKE